MDLIDYAPQPVPTTEQQRDALQKGLGRTWAWASSKCLSDEIVLEACLHDQRFDQQCENSRSEWLWKIVQRMEATERFRAPILEALTQLDDEQSVNQLCEIAFHYAKEGNDTFRRRLYEIVETKPVADSLWLGEKEIISLDGEQAFEFAARIRGERMTTTDWEWDDGGLAHSAIENFGERRFHSILTSSTNPGLKCYYDQWLKQSVKQSDSTKSYRTHIASISSNEICEAAQGQDRCFWFQAWGMQASDSELQTVFNALRASANPNVLSRLLRVFSNRPLPEFDSHLIDLCQHSDSAVRSAAIAALSMNRNSFIRNFAAEQLSKGSFDVAIKQFVNNFEVGDESRILKALKFTEGKYEQHSTLMDITKVLEANSHADCSKLALIAYFETPCQLCRSSAARLLRQQNAAPNWLIDEIAFDAEEQCVNLFSDQDSKIIE